MSEPDPGQQPEGPVAEVAAANAAFYAAFETGDLDAMNALWLDDEETLCVHPGTEAVRGTSAIGRSWAVVMASTPYIQFFLTDVEVTLLGGGAAGPKGPGGGPAGEVATVSCTENVLTADEDTDESSFQGAKAVATHVFVRTLDGWRLWVRHASPVMSGGSHED